MGNLISWVNQVTTSDVNVDISKINYVTKIKLYYLNYFFNQIKLNLSIQINLNCFTISILKKVVLINQLIYFVNKIVKHYDA